MGGMHPAFPTIGSTMTAAISFGWVSNAASTAAMSLYGRASVSAAISSGTPAEPGMPNVATPDPAFTSSPSECPW